MFKRKRWMMLAATFALLVLLLGIAVGCAPDEEPEPEPDPDEEAEPDEDPEPDMDLPDEVVFATGPTGGSWYPLGVASGEIWERELGVTTHTELGGGEANIRGVHAGQYDFGHSHSFAVINAIDGIGPFEGDPQENIAGVAALYPNVQQTVVLADSDIYSIDDLPGKRIGPGPQGFGGETLAQWILDYHDLSYDDMGTVEHVGYSDAVALMADRHLDVFWPNTLMPAPSIEELAVTGPGVRIVELEDHVIEALEDRNPGLMRFTVPAGTYRGHEEDVDTITTFTIIITRPDMSEEAVYQFTKALIENRERKYDVSAFLEEWFTPEQAPVGIGVELHPGARRYYEEIGVLD